MSIQNALTFLQIANKNKSLQLQIMQTIEHDNSVDWPRLAATYNLVFSHDDFYKAFQHDQVMRQFHYYTEK